MFDLRTISVWWRVKFQIVDQLLFTSNWSIILLDLYFLKILILTQIHLILTDRFGKDPLIALATVEDGVPGIRERFDTQTEKLLSPWLGEEAYMFRSPHQWRGILGNHPDMESWE